MQRRMPPGRNIKRRVAGKEVIIGFAPGLQPFPDPRNQIIKKWPGAWRARP